VSIVGMAKNTGKTTCLNYTLRRLRDEGVPTALTSVGVDGEERDALYRTPKPRITLYEGMLFVTTEQDFARRSFAAEVLALSERSTPLGRLVTARAEGTGEVVVAGPSDTLWLREILASLRRFGAALTLVDGALSRMTPASPAVTDALILCTGSACTPHLPALLRQTAFRYSLICLPEAGRPLRTALEALDGGVWRANGDGSGLQKIADSVFTFGGAAAPCPVLYVGGAVTDSFLRMQCAAIGQKTTLVVRDFTKLFIDPATCARWVRRGGSIEVLHRTTLLAVCTNPVAPEGAVLDPVILKNEMAKALSLPVYDLVKETELRTKS
jgi:hypothetical protein